MTRRQGFTEIRTGLRRLFHRHQWHASPFEHNVQICIHPVCGDQRVLEAKS